MSGHTPGPWRVDSENCGSGGIIVATVRGKDVRVGSTSRVMGWTPGPNAMREALIDEAEAMANANLFAASPDLRKAALFTLAYGLDVPVADPNGIVGSVPIVTGRQLLEAAIAKTVTE